MTTRVFWADAEPRSVNEKIIRKRNRVAVDMLQAVK
jgi:hypothetical protein